MMGCIRKQRVSVEVQTVKSQGPRQTMEDTSCVEPIGDNLLMLCVFDGHGGLDVASMCAKRAHVIMKSLISSNPDMSICLRLLYKRLDEEARLMDRPTVGATAAIAIITKDRVWFSNCGDTMIALKMKNGSVCYVSQDHKVENERARLEAAGGIITTFGGCSRIFGTLNIARSIGDVYMKSFVISDPFVTATSFPKTEIDWIMLASDGLWDVYNPVEVSQDLERFDRDLRKLSNNAYKKGSMDNITIVQALFQPML